MRERALPGCGECRACCVVLGFEARPDELPFAKPAGEPCPHLCASGCAIYAARPPVCRRFRCAWLQEPTLPEFSPPRPLRRSVRHERQRARSRPRRLRLRTAPPRRRQPPGRAAHSPRRR